MSVAIRQIPVRKGSTVVSQLEPKPHIRHAGAARHTHRRCRDRPSVATVHALSMREAVASS
jgi:hypothetical protein